MITVCDYYYSQDDVIMASDRLLYFERNIKTRKERATAIIIFRLHARVRPAGRRHYACMKSLRRRRLLKYDEE